MPCAASECERTYWANLDARNHLKRLNIKIDPKLVYENAHLCELCSKLSKSELIQHGLEEWYLNHLFIDAKKDVYATVREILRIYA